MTKDIFSEDTTVVATYTSRHDAEMAKSFLEDQGIASFVVADDVHPPIQLTGGVRLYVMSSEVHGAREALEDAHMAGGDVSGDGAAADANTSKPARLTSWIYIAGFLLMLVAILAGLLFST